jgi:carbon-monoxide dehydrogenase medium subunit
MYPARFDYHRASSVDEALRLLEANDGAKLLAGGHSLIPMMKLRLAQPPAVIDIGRIVALSGISVGKDSIRIGSLTPHAEIAASSDLEKHCLLLKEAAGEIGDPQVRNRGTIGGNIAHADPASDLPGVLRALGATIHIKSKKQERSVAAKDFFTGLLTTDLGEHEIITAIEVPKLGAGTGSAYSKFEHPASGYAVVGAAAWVTVSGGKCTAASLAYNGLQETPLSADGVVSALVGKALDDAAIESACAGLQASDPISDVFASGEYRLHLAKVFGKRALTRARDRAR